MNERVVVSFCTAINCMDGRVQLPVIEYLKDRFGVTYVDSVTEPGPVKILAEQIDSQLAESIFDRVDISVGKHKSTGIAIVAHFNCAGNPAEESAQKKQLISAIENISVKYPELPVVGLWVDNEWKVFEVKR